MKYVGVWWGMHLGVETWAMDDRHGATTENAKRYIDFAAANNIQGVLFEGWNEGWENWGGSQSFDFTKPYADFDIAEIVRYARERGIEIIGHHETGGNIPDYERQLERAVKWYADLGIHNLKTGYAGGISGGNNHHGQYMVRHYQHVVETAAKYRMTVNAHEPIKDAHPPHVAQPDVARRCARQGVGRLERGQSAVARSDAAFHAPARRADGLHARHVRHSL